MLGMHCGKPTRRLKDDAERFIRQCIICHQVFTQRKRLPKTRTIKFKTDQVDFLKKLLSQSQDQEAKNILNLLN